MNGEGILPKGRVCNSSCVFCVFTSLLQAEILGKISGEVPNSIFINCPGVSFQGHSLHRLVGTRTGSLWSVLMVLRQPWCCLSDFAAFLGLELQYN